MITKLLASDGYITVNKQLIKEIGLYEAILLSELCSEFDYYSSRNELDDDGFFFSTSKNIEEKLTIKRDKQTKILNTLKDLGLIDIKIKGIPARRYIKINEKRIEDKIRKLDYAKTEKEFTQNTKTSLRKNRKLDYAKTESNNNIINNNRIIKTENNISILEKKEDLFLNNTIDIFIKQAKEILNQNVYLLKEHREKILELNRAIDNFEEITPEVLRKLKALKFDFGGRTTKPNIDWLLKDTNFIKLLNDELPQVPPPSKNYAEDIGLKVETINGVTGIWKI